MNLMDWFYECATNILSQKLSLYLANQTNQKFPTRNICANYKFLQLKTQIKIVWAFLYSLLENVEETALYIHMENQRSDNFFSHNISACLYFSRIICVAVLTMIINKSIFRSAIIKYTVARKNVNINIIVPNFLLGYLSIVIRVR